MSPAAVQETLVGLAVLPSVAFVSAHEGVWPFSRALVDGSRALIIPRPLSLRPFCSGAWLETTAHTSGLRLQIAGGWLFMSSPRTAGGLQAVSAQFTGWPP
jgi:hypothetical protein